MHLDSEFLANALHANGFDNWEALFVSSETLATKATGRQWIVIKQAYPQLDQVLHIGDDEIADGINPVQHGIKTLIYSRARSERRVGARLTPDLLPFSLIKRASVLEQRRAPIHTLSNEDHWEHLGRTLGAIVIAGFLQWLRKKVRTHKIDRLYFCARDGWLMRQAWKAAKLDQLTGIEDHYLYISRRPLNLAYGYMESTDNRLSSALLDFLCLATSNHAMSVRTALERANLSSEEGIKGDIIRQMASLDVALNSQQNIDMLKVILSNHADKVRYILRENYDALVGYMAQEKLGMNGRSALVDMGWHGTMQRSLQQILRQQDNSEFLCGFYYGLWPAATGNRYAAGLMESAFATDFASFRQQPEIFNAVEILEELHSAPHGTVTSYEMKNGIWMPICASSPAEMQQYRSITCHFQKGVLESIEQWFATGHGGTIELSKITPSAVRSALGSVCMSPTLEEALILGKLGHCATFDHSHLESITSAQPCPSNEHEIRSALSHSSWHIGTIRAWMAKANDEQLRILRKIAHEIFSSWGERALRQFN